MDYGIGIGCALFFSVLSTLILRSVAEYGIASVQTADENSTVKEEDGGKAGDNRIHEQILPTEYIKYLVMVCITGIVVSVFLIWYYQQDLHYVVLTEAIISVLWACSWYDRKYHLIPNRILVYSLILRAVIFAVQIAVNPGELRYILLSSGIAAAALMIGAVLCRLLSPNSVGFGDVKLLGVMGLYLGINHVWSPIFVTLIILFVAGLYLLIFKKADRKTEIPLAPFLLAGTVLAAIITGA